MIRTSIIVLLITIIFSGCSGCSKSGRYKKKNDTPSCAFLHLSYPLIVMNPSMPAASLSHSENVAHDIASVLLPFTNLATHRRSALS